MQRKILPFSPQEFSILTHSVNDSQVQLYNQTYLLWRDVWNETFAELGDHKKVDGSQYYFLDEFCVIHMGNEPIAMIAIKWLDLSLIPASENCYFDTFPPETKAVLEKRNLRLLMSIGNLVVHPDWRKGISGVNYSAVVIGLALQRMAQFGAESALCYTRNNRGINKIIYDFGGVPLWQDLTRHNVKIDVAIIPIEKLAIHPDSDTAGLIDSLWSRWTRKQNQHHLKTRAG